LNCSSQEATANPPRRNPNAPSWFAKSIMTITFCGISWQPHGGMWNFGVFWRRLYQANATAASEFTCNVVSQFRFKVKWLEPNAFLPTHFVGYLDNLMSVVEVWKCLGKYAFRQMRLSPQNLVKTCSRDFDFNLDDWNQIQFCRHILLNISTTSCLFLKFKSVLESMHSGKCDCLLRSWWRRVLAISI
jgi:hypothetical protein